MIDTDKCKHILYDATFNPIDVYDVAEELLAEVERLRDAIERAIAYNVGHDALKVLCKALGIRLNPTRGDD